MTEIDSEIKTGILAALFFPERAFWKRRNKVAGNIRKEEKKIKRKNIIPATFKSCDPMKKRARTAKRTYARAYGSKSNAAKVLLKLNKFQVLLQMPLA